MWRDMAREMARETRRRPHLAVRHWNGVPLGTEGVVRALGSWPGQLAPGIGPLLAMAEAVFSIARPRPPAYVFLRLGERDRAAMEMAVSGYGECGRQGIGPKGHLAAGVCFAWLGRHREALSAYARAGGAEPAGLLPCLVGISLACLGRHAEACGAYEESLRMAPGLGVARAALEVSRAAPEGSCEDPDGTPLVLGLDTRGGASCAWCGRKAHGSGHEGLGSAEAGSLCAAHCAGVESWRLCHAPGRWLACWLGAVKAGLLALPLAALSLAFVDPDLAVLVYVLGTFWRDLDH